MFMSQFSRLLNRIEMLAVYISPLNRAGGKEQEVTHGFELFWAILCLLPSSCNG